MAGLWTRTAVLLGALVALGGCGGGGPSPAGPPNGAAPSPGAGAQLRGTIKIDGSSTVYPITEAVAEEFQKQNPGVRVTVGISGTGGGFKKLGPGEIDISDASRPIRANEAELCAKSGVEFVELPIAYDALTVVVNPRNDWAQSITAAELKKMWEPAAQGVVTKWSQVRPGWPDRPLKLYGAGSDSGTFDYFTDAINGKEKACRGDYTASEDDNVLVQGVSRDPNALGFFGLAYFQENEGKLKALPIDDEKAENGAGPQEPSVDNVVKGAYQPLSRPLFIYVNTKSAARPEVKAFVDYYLREAPRFVKEVGYVELQPEVYQLATDRFAKGTTGSIFAGGGSQVGVKLDDLLKQEQK
jgi:phosphate transport system substrate-binding protein